MDDSLSTKPESEYSDEPQSESHASKRRKTVQKKVVSVNIRGNEGNLKNEGPPSDCWSWRKYGQKTIKGSPYPRGYYRCSTSKGCLAKKQVERCRTDGSMFIITYTSSHNHPGPDVSTINHTTQPTKQTQSKDLQSNPGKEQQEEHKHDQTENSSDGNEDHSQYINSPINSSQTIAIGHEEDEVPLNVEVELQNHKNRVGVPNLDEEQEEEPILYSQQQKNSVLKSTEVNDFFDELEELPTPPFFTSFMRSCLFSDERIHVSPS